MLDTAYRAWLAGAPMRSRRERYKRFTYGDQWSDIVEDSEGRPMREERLIRLSGKRPVTNNLIRQLVKNIVGRYRTRCAEAALYAGPHIGELARRNALAELDSRLMEEFLISGCAIQRIVAEPRFRGDGVWIDNVDPAAFFTNRFRDPRGWDIELAGMLHDMTYPELVNRFAGGRRTREENLRRIYSPDTVPAMPDLPIGEALDGGAAFFRSADPGRFRVIEVWSFDARRSKKPDCHTHTFAWHCRWLAPDGSVLAEYDSPFAHRSHPFALKYYPLTDGEIHSFVEDVIDQQKAINRLMVQIDHMMATSAKGVLLFPLDQKPADIDWRDISDRWAQPDGVIPVTGRGAQLPTQVISNTAGSGAYQLLQLQMKLFEDVSGVSEALLGKGISGARGTELYESQLRNATVALADIFDSFGAFVEERNEKASGTLPTGRKSQKHPNT